MSYYCLLLDSEKLSQEWAANPTLRYRGQGRRLQKHERNWVYIGLQILVKILKRTANINIALNSRLRSLCGATERAKILLCAKITARGHART